MSTHTIHATITVDATNTTLLAAVPGLHVAAGQDERAQLQTAVDAGLRELKSLGARYGFKVTDATATVD